MGPLPGRDDDSREEVLVVGGSSRRGIRRIVLIVVVLVAAMLAYALTRGHPGSSAAQHTRPAAPSVSGRPSMAANDVLVPGLSNGNNTDITDRVVTYSAELVNTSPDTLTVAYPIRLSDTYHVSVLYAEVVGKAAWMDGLQPQPRLTRIAGHEHVVLWIGVHVRCARGAGHETWPIAASTIAIPLAGFSAPATFSAGDLFSSRSWVHADRLCAPHPHS